MPSRIPAPPLSHPPRCGKSPATPPAAVARPRPGVPPRPLAFPVRICSSGVSPCRPCNAHSPSVRQFRRDAGGTLPAFSRAMPSIEAFLREMIERGASDLHLTTNSPPMIRLHGELVALAHPPLSATDTKNLSYSLLTEAQKKKFEEESELDFSFGIKGVSRYRGNLYLQKGAVGGAFRTIPHKTPQLD